MKLPDPSLQPPAPSAFEPALVRGVVMALLGLLTSCGLVIGHAEQGAIAGLAVAVVSLVQAFWTRRAVYSPVTAGALLHTPPPMEYVDHDHGGPVAAQAPGLSFDDILAELGEPGAARP